MPSTTRDYLEHLAAGRGRAIVVTTMTASKVWPAICDDVLDFHYLPSAMGHAGDIALGLALARPERAVICVNGDGSLAMNLGSLITAADAGAANLVMLVLENGAYDIVGGGRVPGAGQVDYAAAARACGWPTARRIEDALAFSTELSELLAAPGPSLAALSVADPPSMPITLPSRHPCETLRILRRHLGTLPSRA